MNILIPDQGRIEVLGEVIFGRHGYHADGGAEDISDANLMCVIDRRKGLPVVLGVLCVAQAFGQEKGLMQIYGSSESDGGSATVNERVADEARKQAEQGYASSLYAPGSP